MYRSRRRRSFAPGCLIFLGIFAGLVFLVYDQIHKRTGDQPAPPTSTAAPISNVTEQAVLPTTTPNIVAEADIVDTRLFIPKIGVYAPIIRVYVDGTSWDVSQLGMNVGHLQGTTWLDTGPGNIVLSAHVEMADGRHGVFVDIDKLEPGDLVIIESPGETRYYSVVKQEKVEPGDLKPVYPTTTDQVTLLTCGNYDFFRDSYLERIVVVAERIN
jgi:LPXTG-site transpeptidase (sortase) family protein